VLLAFVVGCCSGAPLMAGERTNDGVTSIKTVTPQEHHPLSVANGSVAFDVQERLRFEARENNFDFNNGVDDATDDEWLLQRFRIGVLVKPAPWLKVYAQGQDAREFGSERPNIPGVLAAEGDDQFDLRQAYFEAGDSTKFPLALKIGRQILSYGDERLIGSPLPSCQLL